MLTFGEWRILAYGMAIGGVITATWLKDDLSVADFALLDQPPRHLADSPIGEGSLERVANAAIGVAAGAAEASFSPSKTASADELHLIAQVASVTGGDTIRLEGVSTEVGLYGVDAPHQDEVGFAEAGQTLAALVNDQVVSCDSLGADKDQRILARCKLGDGADVSEAMIASGAVSAAVGAEPDFEGSEAQY